MGVQVLYLRYRMTGPIGGEPYRFFTNRSELDIPERDSERSEESIFYFF